MKQISKEKLNKILENHQLWLDSKCSEGERADLSGYDLKSAYLREVNLREASLREANLREAKFNKKLT